MNIGYSDSIDGISPENLKGFFVGWNDAPSAETHLHLLENSNYKILAKDGSKVVGFITAISDNTLAAYIPFLEVLPEYQNKGIGKELVKRMLARLEDYYMIDLLCDSELQPFYENLGMQKAIGMRIRQYKQQGGWES